MPQIVVSDKTKAELENIKDQEQLKSLDAVIRFLQNASVTIKDVVIIRPDWTSTWIEVEGCVKVDTTGCTIKVEP